MDQSVHLVAIEVDQLSAALALAMVAVRVMTVVFRVDIFKTGAAGLVNVILAHLAFLHQAVQLPVDGRDPDGFSLGAEVVAYVGGCEMHARDGFQVGEKLFFLLGFVGNLLYHVWPSLEKDGCCLLTSRS